MGDRVSVQRSYRRVVIIGAVVNLQSALSLSSYRWLNLVINLSGRYKCCDLSWFEPFLSIL